MKKARIKSSLLFWNELERLKSSPYPQHKEGVGFAHAPFRRRGNTMDSDVRDGGPGEPWAPWEKRVSYRVTLPRRLKKPAAAHHLDEGWQEVIKQPCETVPVLRRCVLLSPCRLLLFGVTRAFHLSCHCLSEEGRQKISLLTGELPHRKK